MHSNHPENRNVEILDRFQIPINRSSKEVLVKVLLKFEDKGPAGRMDIETSFFAVEKVTDADKANQRTSLSDWSEPE